MHVFSAQQPWSVPVLKEIIVVLLVYWDKHRDWMEEEHRSVLFLFFFYTEADSVHLLNTVCEQVTDFHKSQSFVKCSTSFVLLL